MRQIPLCALAFRLIYVWQSSHFSSVLPHPRGVPERGTARRSRRTMCARRRSRKARKRSSLRAT
jgi:hypothetical protein